MEDVFWNTNWEDVICPICLDFPHNGVLLQCSSYEKGCHPFVCDTDHLRSNCLDRLKTAYGMSSPSTSDTISITNVQLTASEDNCRPTCPLCRGEVTGSIVVDKARLLLDEKKRSCEQEQRTFAGTYLELQKHAQLEHSHAHPSRIDPVWQLDWENFQQSSEIIDVLSTIYSEVPRGVVLGDYIMVKMNLEMNLRTSLLMRATGGPLVFYIRCLKTSGILDIEGDQESLILEGEVAALVMLHQALMRVQ